MIIIFSIPKDISTNYVIDWITHMNGTCKRIDIVNLEFSTEVHISKNKNDISITLGKETFFMNDIKAFWYRRGNINNSIVFTQFVKNDFFNEITNHLKEEFNTLEEFIIRELSKKNCIGSYYQGNSNKLISLVVAKEVGLEIPETIVSGKKKRLKKHLSHKNSYITKGIQGILSFGENNLWYHNFTEYINKHDLSEMSDSFFPSLIQENIKKKYELRIFYLRGDFYSMAIFSQNDKQTKVDFRNYNYEKPNRSIPFNLPNQIEKQLDSFMKKMHLDTGSIDMIVTPDLRYVFLEVNPVGQYDMVSVPCNYHLDQKIAIQLLSTD